MVPIFLCFLICLHRSSLPPGGCAITTQYTCAVIVVSLAERWAAASYRAGNPVFKENGNAENILG